ncbi:MAG: peptidase [Ignavibacteriae bacterium HGW-Ignavibacteriae-3]|nr:MAG: peptidase [Ignavibacteriae bacterium HGW-Ignavibacteriae-3]
MRKLRYFLSALLLISTLLSAQSETVLYKRLKSFSDIVQITPVKHDTTFAEAYELMITQPVDHNKPDGAKFKQKVYLSHRDDSSPVVFVTEGYAAPGNRPAELTRILQANQIIVEHRYFGKSVPDKIDWEYLTIRQSANDHHALVQLFKNIYSGKWISTGISKGGQTTLFFKRFYPNDVDVSVPYVAPINLAAEDPRIYMFLNSVGTEDCRNKIIQFQRAFLEKRAEIINLLMKDVEKKNLRLAWDYDFVLEYMTLEYSFAFWQWGNTKCDDIPSADSPAEKLYEHMVKANPLYFFTEQAMKDFGPFYVQAYNEIGYYGYDLEPFKDLLTQIKDGSNILLVPEGVKVNFDCRVMNDVNNWLQKKGKNIIYIYGGNDTWSATSIQLLGETNSVKMVKQGGAHGTRIASFNGEQKEKIYSTLEAWLGIQIRR